MADQFREQIARDVDALAQKEDRVPKHRRAFLQSQILDNRIAVLDEYVIVIGRRGTLTPDDNQRRSYEGKWATRVEIASFDRLLDIGLQDRSRARRERARTV
jgi:hypothetical protein